MPLKILTATLAIAGIALLIQVERPADAPVVTNSSVIESQDSGPDLSDPKDVFEYVLRGLPANVTVYPSENYLYFRFPTRGYEIWGSMTLSAATRDDNIIGFGYTAKPEGGRGKELVAPPGGGQTFTADDGLQVERLGDFDYRVRFRDVERHFHLHDVGMAPPETFALLKTERAVSPLMDESGLSFHLIFNRAEKRLYMALNEDGRVAERFRHISPDIIVGERSGFAFYDDRVTGRKLLMGVEGSHVLANDWYDGPFDQMPDNNVRLGRIPDYRDLLLANYPTLRGRIDQYGRYVARPGTRVAVAPYMVYFSKQQLIDRLTRCEDESATSESAAPGPLFACLSEQEFNLPTRKTASRAAK